MAGYTGKGNKAVTNRFLSFWQHAFLSKSHHCLGHHDSGAFGRVHFTLASTVCLSQTVVNECRFCLTNAQGARFAVSEMNASLQGGHPTTLVVASIHELFPVWLTSLKDCSQRM